MLLILICKNKNVIVIQDIILITLIVYVNNVRFNVKVAINRIISVYNVILIYFKINSFIIESILLKKIVNVFKVFMKYKIN